MPPLTVTVPVEPVVVFCCEVMCMVPTPILVRFTAFRVTSL